MTRLAILGAVILLAALAIWHPAPRAAAIVTDHGSRAPRVVREASSAVPSAIVYVVGAVVRPGLYRVSANSRVDDAVRLAGGFRPGADPAGVNLAERLTDGEQVTVPSAGDPPVPRARHSQSSRRKRSRKSASREPALALVDLNAADAQTLEELPGVGAALAARIVAYRSLNGPFVSLDELADVAGMTDRHLQQVEPFLIVH